MRISHGALLSVQLLTHAIHVADLLHSSFNDVFNQERKIHRKKIRLHNGSVREHQ